MPPFTDAAAALIYLGVPESAALLLWQDRMVDQQALDAIVLAVATKLQAIEQRLAALEQPPR
jgi:hypothetical protein